MLENSAAFNVGEMAHVVAKSAVGPRGEPGGGPDTYANLILLCPTCHRLIDKAPEGEFPPDMLFDWKAEHEKEVRSAGKTLSFDNFNALREYTAPLLLENKMAWDEWGPQSTTADSDPSSNAYRIWDARKLSVIVPNNRRILNAVGSSLRLLSPEQVALFFKFKDHAAGFEQNQYGRLDRYTLFPTEFGQIFGYG